MIRDLDVMDLDVVDEYDDVRIVRVPRDGKHVMMDEEGRKLFYDEVPRKAQFLYDQVELRRQGQQKLPFEL
jgi:hypothetical protein